MQAALYCPDGTQILNYDMAHSLILFVAVLVGVLCGHRDHFHSNHPKNLQISREKGLSLFSEKKFRTITFFNLA